MKKPEKMTQEELVTEVKNLRSRKKYGLVWEDKPEDVAEFCKEFLPVLEEVEKRKIVKGDGSSVTNLLIEGDNYHSLSVLNYTHKGGIDFIYFDPPYNTGASDWKYNNNYVDEHDTFRHSKWISMIFKRVKLARQLLKSDGVLCAAIDNYEVHNLRHILEEIFPDKEVIMTVIQHNFRGRVQSNFALTHEYLLWVVPKGVATITRMDEMSDDIKRNLRRTGQNSRRKDTPTMFYGIEVNKKTLEIVGVTESIIGDYSQLKASSPETEMILPIDTNGVERNWYYSAKRVLLEAKTGDVFAKYIKDRIEVHYRKDGKLKRRKSVWTGTQFDSSTHGTELVTKIIGENDFPFPKSLWAVKECIEAATAKKDAVILDFFAGSGTTGHAVIELNKQDGGKRKFILCTNNENNIATDITYPRIKNVINGYKDYIGVDANLRYFKTCFIKKDKVTDDTRRELVQRATEMICVKEDTFEKKYDNQKYKIYSNDKKSTAILYDLDSIEDFKEKLNKLGKHSSIYVFSLTNETFASDFSDLAVKHRLVPIPESILEVYRKLFG